MAAHRLRPHLSTSSGERRFAFGRFAFEEGTTSGNIVGAVSPHTGDALGAHAPGMRSGHSGHMHEVGKCARGARSWYAHLGHAPREHSTRRCWLKFATTRPATCMRMFVECLALTTCFVASPECVSSSARSSLRGSAFPESVPGAIATLHASSACSDFPGVHNLGWNRPSCA